jgi:hypothetical protein
MDMNIAFINLIIICRAWHPTSIDASKKPHENGVSKRNNKSFLKKRRSLALEAKVHNFLWAKSINISNFLANQSPTKEILGCTPH